MNLKMLPFTIFCVKLRLYLYTYGKGRLVVVKRNDQSKKNVRASSKKVVKDRQFGTRLEIGKR